MNRTITYAAGFILVWIVGSLLIAGRGLLIPIIIALFIWNLLNTINSAMQRIPLIGDRLPGWLCKLLSFLVVIGLVKVVIDIITNNVHDVIVASSRYQDNLMHIFNTIDQHYRIKALASFDGFLKGLSVQGLLVNIYGVFTTITSSAVLIALYVAFLFVEQHFFKQKMSALFTRAGHRQVVDSILSHIVKDTQTYLGLKTLLSLTVATASWVIMKSVDLDFAEFWALLIFFLNFIPNIGAIVATAFPALLALIQFQSWIPFAVVTTGIVMVQFVVGNVLEPRLLSKSLNLSPLVILFALALWGSIWGVLGMFLSVPITVMMLIIFAHFEVTRPIAILLSQDGYVKKAYE
jgi:AI-2 transport protein TqsA